MEKTIRVRAYIEMDVEVPECINNSKASEFAIDALKREIDYNLSNDYINSGDFEYEALEVHEGSLLDGTGEYA